MTKVPQGFDFSFLNDEEARKILQVLERNEELQRSEKDRISKLQKTKRDNRWLQGVTGEWFEEIQRKKFCNETDVSQMLKQPLTYRLRKGMAANDPVELQASQCKDTPTQRNSTPIPSWPSFRSSFASLFSFGKSRKDTLKPQWLGQKGCDKRAGLAVSVRGPAVAKLYNSSLENRSVESAFVPKPAGMREGSSVPPWDASMLESEFFRVLDDLDSKLAQEQSPSFVNTRRPLNYGSRTQFSHSHSTGNSHSNTTGRHKNHYNETSNMSFYDILRPRTPREGFKTFSSRIRTIYDMYGTREPRVLKEDYVQKNTFGSSSLCFDSRRLASPATGYFTARSIHFPTTTQNKNGFILSRHHQSPKRTPLSSIMWNRSDPARDRLNQEEFLRTSPMETDPVDQHMYPRCFQENRGYEFYHSQNVYQNTSLNSPMGSTMSPDPFENSENMPFYHQDNPFARSFFSNTFGRTREQRFGHSFLGGQQEEHSSWSGFNQSRKPFNSSDRDFEMTSTEANSASPGCVRNVSFQRWESFSPSYRTTISRDQEEPHPSQFDSQTSTQESMEVSQGDENQMAHLGTPNICSTMGSSYHIKPGGLECQQDSSLKEVHINQEPYSFGIAQIPASSFKTSFSQVPDDKGNHQGPNFQNPVVTLQKIKPASLPIRSYTEVTVTNRNSVPSPPLTQSQPNILVTEVNNEKDLNDSIMEKNKQLNKMDLTNTSEMAQPASETGTCNPLVDFQSPLSQHSAKTHKFVFNASTTVSSKESPKVVSRKDSSKMHISQKDKANELKKDKNYTKNRKSGPATYFPFIQESRTPSSFPSPNQGCHQELIVSNEDSSSIIENNPWSSEPPGNQSAQSPETSSILDTKQEQCTKTHSTNCSESIADHNIPCDSVGPSSSTLLDSSPSNNFFLGALVVPSMAVLPRRSLSGKDPSLGEGEKKDNNSNHQNNQCTLSSSETEKNDDGCVPINNEVVDVKYHLHPPLKAGKGKAKIRRRISYIEKLSKTERKSTLTSGSSSLTEISQSDSKVPELHTIHCTLPRKAASFLTNSRKSETKIMPPSFRNEPLKLQIENNLEDPIGKDTSNKFNTSSSKSESRCSKVVSDSASVASEAIEKTTNMTNSESASIRKGPLLSPMKKAVSCPSGVAYASFGRDEREKCLASDMDGSAITLKPWEKTINPLQSDSSFRDCSLTKRHHLKEHFQECTEKDGKIAASKTFSGSNEDPLPFSSDMSGKECGKTLHKLKTTSMFSVFGDEDNVKCLEVVSIYYTLPRKQSKKLCNLLQKYTQNSDSLPGSTKVGTVTLSNAVEKEKLNYSTQEQSGTSSPEHLKMLVSSAQETSSSLSPNTEKVTDLQLLSTSPSGPTLQEVASIEADVALHKGESKTGEVSPDNLANICLGDSQNRKKRGKKLQGKILHTSLIHQDKKVIEEKSANCQYSIISPDSGPSNPPSHAEGIAENLQTGSSRECSGSGIATTATGRAKGILKDVTDIAKDDSSNGSQPKKVREADLPQETEKALSDSEIQVFALAPALHKLHLDGEACSGEEDLHSVQCQPRELPQSQEVNLPKKGKAKDEMQKLAWDQSSLTEGRHKNKTSLDDLVKGKNRSSVKHRLAAMSKANRKFPAKDLSPRRHVATVFPQSGNSSSFNGLSFGTLECNPLSPEPTPKSTESTDESRLNDRMDVKRSENLLQVTVVSNREAATPTSNEKSNGISQPNQNEFKNISESPPKYENSNEITVAQILGSESGTLTQPTFTSLGEADFSDHQRWLNPHLPVEPAKKPTISIPQASCQPQPRSAASLEWEPEPYPYRSKSLKSINVHGDLLRKSHPPKARERHFSESTSIDNALSYLTLGDELSNNGGYSRKFKSSSELPSCDENESWAVYNSRMKMAPKSATPISRPIDYGIFGKEQQLAFLENVKRSLTQGRLWKPSFLKNPGFLKDDIINPPNPTELSSSDFSRSQMPEDGLSPSVPLNIYEEYLVDSDCDTDTTTDDEYYLDENDKESEL